MHFALLSLSVALIFLVLSTKTYSATAALTQLDQIITLRKNWRLDGLRQDGVVSAGMGTQRSTSKEKPNTVKFYENSVDNLNAYTKIASLRLDTSDIVGAFVEHRQAQRQERRNQKRLEVSTINRDLATLRRMFHLAQEWGKVSTLLPKVKMLPGENQRERVLTTQEETACRQ